MVPEEETIPLDMSVEDAFKLLISVGLAVPGKQQPGMLFGRRSADGRLAQATGPGAGDRSRQEAGRGNGEKGLS
jgi:hypothetical protein